MTETDAVMSKPFLKWAGGKSKLVATLSPFLGETGRLVEPFVGSGAVFMGTRFARYRLCDSNADLIGLFNHLKQNPQHILDETAALFQPAFNTEAAFYRLRDEFNLLPSGHPRKAALFVYLNKHAFNGLCRYNSKGAFNVPFGRYRAPVAPLKDMALFAQKALLADFSVSDFSQTFAGLEAGDVVYCDPPYVPLSPSASFTAYSQGGFGEDQQRQLAELAIAAAQRGVRVVVSNHDTPWTRTLYASATIHAIQVHRSISSKGSTRGAVSELIAVFG